LIEMNIFKRNEAAAEEPNINGVHALRARLAAWSAKPAVLQAVARDVEGVGIGSLQDFIAGKREFSAEILVALTMVVYEGHAVFDPVSMMLKSAYKDQPVRSFVRPDPYKPPADYVVVRSGGLRGLQASETKTTMERMGWLGTFYPVAEKAPEPAKREKFVRLREHGPG
jgi:hypothetical protein